MSSRTPPLPYLFERGSYLQRCFVPPLRCEGIVTAVGREVEQLGPAVLIRGDAVARAYMLASAGLDRGAAAGLNERACRELLDALAAATADQRKGHEHVRSSTRTAESGRDQHISTAEAAAILGVSERQARRLAPQLGCLRGGTWQLDRALVHAHNDIRQDRYKP
jgi:hypothetical protein